MTTPDSYNGNIYIKRDGVQQSFTAHEVNEYRRCMADVGYFAEKYVKVISLDHGLVPFKLRGYQEKMVKHFSDNRFTIILACRQSGKCSVGETEITIKFLDGPPLRAKISLVHEIFYALSTLQKSLFYKYKHDLPKEQVFKDLFLPDGEAQALFVKLWGEASYFSKRVWWKQFRREPSDINFKRAFYRSSFISEDVSKVQPRMEEDGLCPSHDDAHTRWHKNKILTFIRKCSNQLHKCFIGGKQWREKSLLWKNSRGSSKGHAKQKSFGRIQKEYLQENKIYLGGDKVSGEDEKPENKFRVITWIRSIRGTQRKYIKRPEETSRGSGLCITEHGKGNIRGNEEETLKGWKGEGNISGNKEQTFRTSQREEVYEGTYRKYKKHGEKKKEGTVSALRKDRRSISDVEVAFRQLPSTKKFIESFEGFGFVVETDSGFQPLKQSHKTIPYTIWEVKTECGKYLRCADNHILFNEEFDNVYVKDLKEGSVIQTKDGCSKVVGVQRCGKEVEMYDLGVDFTDHRFYTNDILSHNSITSVAWLLHYAIFNANKKIGILANKGATAREMLSRITLMLENLPFFLQPGCKVLNKGNILFSNNSEIIAAATSGSSIRGLSMNCVTGDAKICVNINDNIYYAEIDDFINKSKFIEKEIMHYTVYKITNLINNKIYVGYHATNDLNDGYMGSGKLIKRAIEKYGIANFKKEILSVFDNKADAENEERRIVNKDFTLREDTYNLSEGGNILVLHGPNNGFYGKTHSKETKEKLREAKVGKHSGTGKKIIHDDGRIFETLEDAINKLGYDEDTNNYAARIKLICDCGNSEKPIKFVDTDDQQAAVNVYMKRIQMIASLPDTRKATGKIISEKLKGVKKTKEHCNNISAGLTGIKKSKEHVDKINKNPEKIKKTAEKHRGMTRSDDCKLKMSSAKKGKSAKNKGKKYYVNPENTSERGYFNIGEQPEKWVNRTKI
jgi:hypothetical protein